MKIRQSVEFKKDNKILSFKLEDLKDNKMEVEN